MANERGHLRIADLKRQHPASTRLMNVRIPADTDEAIARLAEGLGTSKTEVVLALLNEGLAILHDKIKR